jgi:hypothetical protein
VCRWRATYCWNFFDKGCNFDSNLTSIAGLHTKLWASKVVGVPILGILRLSLGSPGTKWHLGAGLVAKHIVYYKGEGGGFPSSLGCGESCESMFARGLSVHQRCFSCTLTNLLFGLCRSVWVIDLLINLPNPHPEALAHPSTPEMLWTRERAPTPSLSIVFIFGLIVESIKELGGASHT